MWLSVRTGVSTPCQFQRSVAEVHCTISSIACILVITDDTDDDDDFSGHHVQTVQFTITVEFDQQDIWIQLKSSTIIVFYSIRSAKYRFTPHVGPF